MKKIVLALCTSLSFAFLPTALAAEELEPNQTFESYAEEPLASEENEPMRPYCRGQRYEWGQVIDWRTGRVVYRCYLTELRYAWQLGQCEWNRVRQVPNNYCQY